MQKIPFNDQFGLTKAVLEGRKPMTRRTEKTLKLIIDEYERINGEPFRIIRQEWNPAKRCIAITTPNGQIDYSPKYKMDEIVAVAQPYKDVANTLHFIETCLANEWRIDYRDAGWNNKMFVKPCLMPHQIRITNIRIERLQDISEEDCLKEGVYINESSPRCYHPFFTFKNSFIQKTPLGWDNAIGAFAALINRPGVGRKGLWEENPWVVVYEFEQQ